MRLFLRVALGLFLLGPAAVAGPVDDGTKWLQEIRTKVDALVAQGVTGAGLCPAGAVAKAPVVDEDADSVVAMGRMRFYAGELLDIAKTVVTAPSQWSASGVRFKTTFCAIVQENFLPDRKMIVPGGNRLQELQRDLGTEDQ